MRKQRKMEYKSPNISEIEFSTADFMDVIGNGDSNQLGDMKVTDMNDPNSDGYDPGFWGKN